MCDNIQCVKNVRIRTYSGSYSVRMRENTDQNNSEYGHLLRSDCQDEDSNTTIRKLARLKRSACP